jgi:hypothetical protein
MKERAESHFEVPAPAMKGVEVFSACAAAGALSALIMASLLAHHRHLSLTFLAILAGCTLASQAVYSIAAALLTQGQVRLVLYHRAGLFVLTTAVAARVSGEAVEPWMDVVTPALFLFVAFGRVGCWAAGCCYGRPSRFGAVYSEAHCAAVTDELIGVPLFPVQLVEAGAAVCVAVVGAAGGSAPFCFALYAGVRFVLEYFRGEPGRRRAFGLTEAHWTSALLLIAINPMCAVLLVAIAAFYRPISPDQEVQLTRAISCCTRVERATVTTSFGISLTRDSGTLRIHGLATPQLLRHLAFLDRLVCASLNR